MKRLVAALLCTAAVATQLRVAPAAGPAVAMVTGIYGHLSVNHGTAKVSQVLHAGDEISTDDRSRAVVLLADGSQLKLQYDTKVKLTSRKGVFVEDGEVFASMAKQHGVFTFAVPHGRAGVVGTELDIKVARAEMAHASEVTTLTVAKGKVDFYGNEKVGRAVRVNAGTQSLLARKDDAVTSSEAALAPSEPVEVDVDPIIAWNKQVQAYSDAISKLSSQYELLAADTEAHSGFVNPELMDELNQDEELIQSLVPDEDFEAGHQDLLLAYQNYKLSLTMTANPALQQASLQKANAAYHAADLALKRYIARHQDKVRSFTRQL